MSLPQISMDDRIEREKRFHNVVFDEHSTSSRRAAERLGRGLMARPKELAHRLIIERYRPTRILEYGCGPGWYAQQLAKHFKDAQVVGIDISDVAVEQAARRASQRDLHNVRFQAMDAEHVEFEDGYFDLVVGLGILHHLDLEKALAEIERVLQPGGNAVFVEPLAHNPALNLFRRCTPRMRTVDEHPLTMQDFELISSHFAKVENHFVNLTTLCALAVPQSLGRTRLIGALGACDRALFRLLPISRRFAWSVVMIGSKSHQECSSN